MAEIKLNHPNWLGSEVGYLPKSVTITSSSATPVTENGRQIIKSGTLITDSVIGTGLLVNDADVTDGAVAKSIMIGGRYINAQLPTALTDEQITELASHGLYNVTYADTKISFGEVTD